MERKSGMLIILVSVFVLSGIGTGFAQEHKFAVGTDQAVSFRYWINDNYGIQEAIGISRSKNNDDNWQQRSTKYESYTFDNAFLYSLKKSASFSINLKTSYVYFFSKRNIEEIRDSTQGTKISYNLNTYIQTISIGPELEYFPAFIKNFSVTVDLFNFNYSYQKSQSASGGISSVGVYESKSRNTYFGSLSSVINSIELKYYFK